VKDEIEKKYSGQLLELLARLPRQLQSMKPMPFGLKLSEALFLSRVQYRSYLKEENRLSDLAEDLGLSKSTVSNLVSPLERGGFIEKESSPQDGRVFIVQLTSLGEKACAALKEYHEQTLRELLNFLGEEDSVHLIRIMQKVEDFLG
jgi:DNA-binding MarR family transcriptional regulator